MQRRKFDVATIISNPFSLQNMVYSDKEFPLTEHIVKNHVNREVDKLLEREYDRIAALEKPVLPEVRWPVHGQRADASADSCQRSNK